MTVPCKNILILKLESIILYLLHFSLFGLSFIIFKNRKTKVYGSTNTIVFDIWSKYVGFMVFIYILLKVYCSIIIIEFLYLIKKLASYNLGSKFKNAIITVNILVKVEKISFISDISY